MSAISSLISQFETITQANHSPISSGKRVRVKRFDMPLRQSTLNFGSSPAAVHTRRTTEDAMTRQVHVPTPPPESEDVENDTIVINTSLTPPPSRISLPTPSESATDASSQVSSSEIVKNIPRSRSKRVSAIQNTDSTDSLSASLEKQRNISGETLVSNGTDPSASQTSLLKTSIDALDMAWNMSEVFVPANTNTNEPDFQPDQPKRRTTIASEKWEQRRKAAEKNATRRSSRAPILTKAVEVVSTVTSSVLGKRDRKGDSEPTQPEQKKHCPETTTSVAATSRAIKARAPKDKKWLLSGLYAGQPRTLSTGKEAPNKENRVLPLPMYAGERLLASGRDFKLPFDVFSPLGSQPKPDEWRKVNKNVFVGDATAEWRESRFHEHSTCMCKPSTGCDENCMNKYMYYECDSRNCNLNPEKCGNRAFEGLRTRVKAGGKYNVGVEVMKTADRGFGVRSNRTFEPNQIIVEYTGEIITQEECERRMRNEYKDNECYYLMAFDQNMIIDATRGSIARFVNHACAPNCRMEKWTVGGKPRMALFAGEQGVMTGEELTYDYNFDNYNQKHVQVCRCGSHNCRGVLGPRPKELAAKESKLAGAKRKLVEAIEENLVPKKRKLEDEKGRKSLPKGWAYIEPDPAECQDKATASVKRKMSVQSKASSKSKSTIKKLGRTLSGKSKSSPIAKRKSLNRNSSVGSQDGLLTRTTSASSAVKSLKAKAGSIKKTVGRALRK